MNAAKIELLVTELRDEIYKKLHHRTLLEHTGLPTVWEDQLFYLLLPKFNGEQWTENHQIAATSVSMIQAALTTHDLVKEHNATTKSQQLTVLAGDYYSGMYYATLASLPDVPLVRALSTAVAQISENKTTLYEPDDQTFLRWLEQFETNVSTLIEQFMMHYKFEAYIPLMRKGMLVDRLSSELEQLKKGQSTIKFDDIMTDDPQSKAQIQAQITRTIHELASKFKQDIQHTDLLVDHTKAVLLSRVDTLISEQQMTREG